MNRPDPELIALINEHGGYIGYPVAAKIVGCSAKTLHRLTDAGELPCYAVGRTRTLRVKTSDVYGLIRRVA